MDERGRLTIDLDYLLENAPERADSIYAGDGNIEITIRGSNPQGVRKVLAGKNGNFTLNYNGDLSIVNDAQTVEGTTDLEVRHNLRQEITTENTENAEKISLLQSTVENGTEGKRTPQGKNVSPEAKAVVNGIVMDATKDARKIELLNRETNSVGAESSRNEMVLDGTMSKENVRIANKKGIAVNSMKMDHGAVPEGDEAVNGIELKDHNGNVFVMDGKGITISFGGDDEVARADSNVTTNPGNPTHRKVIIGESNITIQNTEDQRLVIDKSGVAITGGEVAIAGETSVSGNLDVSGVTTLGGEGAESAVLGATLKSKLESFMLDMANHIHPGPTGPTSASPTLQAVYLTPQKVTQGILATNLKTV